MKNCIFFISTPRGVLLWHRRCWMRIILAALGMAFLYAGLIPLSMVSELAAHILPPAVASPLVAMMPQPASAQAQAAAVCNTPTIWRGGLYNEDQNDFIYNVEGMDWSAGGSGSWEGIGPIGTPVAPGTQFTMRYQAALFGLTDSVGNGVAFPGIGTGNFEYTLVAEIPLIVVDELNFGGDQFLLLTTQPGGEFHIYYDADSNYITNVGMGFDDGTPVASGVVDQGQNSNFRYDAGNDTGLGSFAFNMSVNYLDPALIDPMDDIVRFRLEGTLSYPPLDSVTTTFFDGRPGEGDLQEYTVDTNDDILLKVDTSSKFYGCFDGQFGDRVFIESDNDGQADTGTVTPVEGMVITATDGTTVYTTTTNALGYYSFTVPSGFTYTVTYGPVPAQYGNVAPSATPGGNSESGNAGTYAEGGSPDISHANGTTLYIDSEQTNWHVDFGFWLPQPEIVLEKATNGVDADTPPGPMLTVGDPVTWTYAITNMGNVTLANLTLVDDQEDVTGATCAPVALGGQLPPGTGTVCTLVGTVQPGNYSNTGTVTGTPTAGDPTPVEDTDPSHYTTPAQFGDRVFIESDNDGLANTGTVTPVAGMVITASDGVNVYTTTTNAQGYYSFTVPGDVVYTVTYGPVPALYGNVAPSATPGGNTEGGNAGIYAEGGNPDVSHTNNTTVSVAAGEENWHVDFGFWQPQPEIVLEKATNGVDADTPTGPMLTVGDPVTWTYAMTNTGNVTLANLTLVDDQEDVTGATCAPVALGGQLAPGAGTVCTLVGTVQPGNYSNTGTVTGTPTAGDPTPVEDTDPSHYTTPAQFGDRVFIESDSDGLANTGTVTPVAGMVITATDGVNVYTTTTNAQGYYSFTVPGDVPYTVTYGDVPAQYGAVLPSSTPGGNTEGGNAGIYAEGGNPDASHTNNTTVSVAAGEENWHVDFGFWLPQPEIVLEKATNGVDADVPTGPMLTVGDRVTWTYAMTNTGNVTLANLTLVDDQEDVTGATCAPVALGGQLAPGAGTVCTLVGTVQPGNYSNTGTVTGTPTAGDPTPVEDTDPSHYTTPAQFGDRVFIESDSDGLANTGTVTPVAGMVITATDGVNVYTTTTNAQGYYSFTVPGSVTYTVTYGEVPALYGNVAPSATPGGNSESGNAGTYAEGGNPDVSHANGTTIYLGPEETNWHVDFGFWQPQPEIVLEKATNGEDADAPTGPTLTVGDPVTWTYAMTNTGNVTLANLTLVDDQEDVTGATCVPVALGGQLPPGTSTVCTLVGTVQPGQYSNMGTVTGTPTAGDPTPVTDEDPSNYIGVAFDLELEKVLGAGQPTAVQQGDDVVFNIEVRNEGTMDAHNIQVLDSVPDGLSLSANDDNGWSSSGNNVVHTIDFLAAGQQTVLEIVFTVDEDFEGGTIQNIAEITAADNDNDATNAPPVDIDSVPDSDPANDESEEDDHDSAIIAVALPLASISNLVWFDANRNGVQDPGEQGMAGVTVQLYDSDGNLVDETQTDANGNYMFDELPPGDYQLRFIPPAGYEPSPSNFRSDNFRNSDADSETGYTEVTTLDPGEDDDSWDAGFFLTPTALDPTEEPGAPAWATDQLFLPIIQR